MHDRVALDAGGLIHELPLGALCSFLVLAKRHTFAADAPRSAPKSPLSKNYLFEIDDFRYEDQYFGEFVDVGIETVWYRGVPVWGMSYRGGVVARFASIKRPLFDFLREALRQPVPDFPTRGPREYARDALTYRNDVAGDIAGFHGAEQVWLAGEPSSHRRYVGGLILGKRNPDMRLVNGEP